MHRATAGDPRRVDHAVDAAVLARRSRSTNAATAVSSLTSRASDAVVGTSAAPIAHDAAVGGNRAAVAAPMPEAAPVTRTTLSVSRPTVPPVAV